MTKIPVVDLFAGPGGLGEGFTSINDSNGQRIFDIKLSIEKDEHAHNTLTLRNFYRKFIKSEVPELYYKYIKENDNDEKSKLLEQLKMIYNKQWEMAENEAWHLELPYPEEFDKRGNKKGGYTTTEINKIHNAIDQKISSLLKENEEFLLIGGPPCQAYSLVGRARNQGISDKDHRVHLYKEYLRVIAKHNPLVFVMENVKGLLSAKIDDIKVFDLIKEDLKNPKRVFPKLHSYKYKVFSFVKEPDEYDNNGFPVYYRNSDFLIKSENYNIPQRRHRVILLGIREDVDDLKNIRILNKNSNKVSLKEVIGSLPEIRSGIGRETAGSNPKGKHAYKNILDNYENWKSSIKGYQKKLKEQFAFDIINLIDSDNRGGNYQKYRLEESNNPLYKKWFKDDKLKGVLNHESRTHLKEDLGRYIFSALYLKEKGDFPKLKDYPEWLLPNHKNARKGDKFADRFRTQRPDQPATTITSHISKDGHYFIHYDPKQCRSLTVREAARIQTFPDNYYFCGSRTHQYHQVGNAVPPYLAKQIAEIVLEIFKNHKKVQVSE